MAAKIITKSKSEILLKNCGGCRWFQLLEQLKQPGKSDQDISKELYYGKVYHLFSYPACTYMYVHAYRCKH